MDNKSIIIEKGVIAGNLYNKYSTNNPIARLLVKQFQSTIVDLVQMSGVSEIHEVGCGEGYLAAILVSLPNIIKVRASDFSSKIIEKAKLFHKDKNIEFFVRNIYDLNYQDAAEMVVCCEVLEHLEYPEKALKILSTISKPYCLLSVPREPIWRIMNILRGKYLKNFGNTPGHIQHWSKNSFLKLVSKYFNDIVDIRTPFPWTIILAQNV